MDGSFAISPADHLANCTGAAARIAEIQLPDGAIPWFENGPWDAWNHTESAMALTAMGDLDRAAAAFEFLRKTQRPDGAWLGEYGNALPMVDRIYIAREPAPAVLDSNFCAYPAVGVLHYLRATGDRDQVQNWWPMIQAAIDFVLSLQRADGTICWSQEAVGSDEEKALLAGNASIVKSLECAITLAKTFGQETERWCDAFARLSQAVRDADSPDFKPGTPLRFAMDWYYPVLSGAVDRAASKARLDTHWSEFVIADSGCLCVLDEPWITVAETCELVLALISIGAREKAVQLLSDIERQRDLAGDYWMGWQLAEDIMWPREKPSWTQAAVILATDALYGADAASRVLTASVSQTSQQA